MLGRKSVPGSSESLSQGTFVKFLLPHISSKPDVDMNLLKEHKDLPDRPGSIFNEYFRKDQDSTILKILLNVFQGAKDTWPVEWEDPASYTLTKTLGFSGIMRALPDMYSAGKRQGDLSTEYFRSIFQSAKQRMDQSGIRLTSEFFSASASGEARFRDMVLESVSKQ